jgi:hypothetical protein
LNCFGCGRRRKIRTFYYFLDFSISLDIHQTSLKNRNWVAFGITKTSNLNTIRFIFIYRAPNVKKSSNQSTINESIVTQNASPFQTSIGANALSNLTTGTDNTAVGYNALQANTIGYSNTAVGSGALAVNTTGTSNTAIGWHALTSNTTGKANVAIGLSAASSNIAGAYNTAIGLAA